jgi:hypothetical protein
LPLDIGHKDGGGAGDSSLQVVCGVGHAGSGIGLPPELENCSLSANCGFPKPLTSFAMASASGSIAAFCFSTALFGNDCCKWSSAQIKDGGEPFGVRHAIIPGLRKSSAFFRVSMPHFQTLEGV